MKRKEQTIVEKEIPGREHAGYAYIYPLDGGARQEYVLEMTPENIANFIGAHQYDAEKIILTDMLDNLILDTAGGFIMNCPDQILCGRVLPLLAPIQMGRRRAKEIPVVSRAAFEAYYIQGDDAWIQVYQIKMRTYKRDCAFLFCLQWKREVDMKHICAYR